MKYLFDAGNTRVKWALENNGVFEASGALATTEELEAFFSQSHPAVDEVYISSVSSKQVCSKLVQWCKRQFGIDPRIAKVERELAGVRVAYKQLENFGVDRWLALMAAWSKVQSACVVIDAGTTITVDYLNAEGEHVGGMIVPGINMMRGALFDNTSAVKVEALTLPVSWCPGTDTIPCVANGIAAMLRGFFAEIIRPEDDGATIFVTGGDAEAVTGVMKKSAEVHPHLVLEGLLCVS